MTTTPTCPASGEEGTRYAMFEGVARSAAWALALGRLVVAFEGEGAPR